MNPCICQKKKDNFKRPAIIWVPGDGSRQTNNKNKDLGRTHYFSKHGFIVVSVQYRSSAQAKWPAQIIDVKTAIRWVRKHAADYQIDADHIGIMGRSAGSHIAVVPTKVSEELYQKLVETGIESRSYLYWVKDAGRGTPEIFQDSALQIMSDFY